MGLSWEALLRFAFSCFYISSERINIGAGVWPASQGCVVQVWVYPIMLWLELSGFPASADRFSASVVQPFVSLPPKVA